MDKNDNPYEVLELTPSATEAEIKKAYRQLARKYHPDKQKTDEDRAAATEHFAKISDAYDLLNDPVRRYDWRMKNESSQPRSSSTSTSTSTSTKAASQSTTSQTKTTTKTTTPSARAHTPTPSAPRTSQVPMKTARSSVAPSQPPNVGVRPRSVGPGGGRRAPTGGMARPSSFGSNMSAAAKRASSPGRRARTTAPLKRSSSPGPGMHPRRAVASDIPRRSMAGTSPRRAQSPRPEPGRKNHTSGASVTRKPKRRTSLSSESSTRVRKPKSVPNMRLDARSDHSVSSRRKPKMSSMGGLDSRSEHTRRMPRRPSMDSASVSSAGSRKLRRPGSKNSLNSMNNTRMRRPSSGDSVNSAMSMKSCKSAPGLRQKKKSLLGGVSLRGSTANMRNATFDSPSSRSTKSSKSAISRKILKVKPLSGRA